MALVSSPWRIPSSCPQRPGLRRQWHSALHNHKLRALDVIQCAWRGSNADAVTSGVPGALLLALAIVACPAEARDATPYELAKSLPYGVVEGTRSLRACPSNINPNCVATGSTNDTYGPAWRANETDPARAARALEDAIQDLFSPDEARLLSAETIDGVGEYRAFGINSAFGMDVAEFLIKAEGVTNRNWAGDTEGALVTYRSLAGSTKYIWPIQQPLSDFDTQRKRLTSIRLQLGWQVIGCELMECYQ